MEENRLKNLLRSYPKRWRGHARPTWIAVHGGKVVLVVLVWGQLPGADGRVECVGVGDKVGVSQVGGQVVRWGERRGVGGRVTLRRLGGHHHPADPRGVLQHLRETEETWFCSTGNSKWWTRTSPNGEFDPGQVETLQIFRLEAIFKAQLSDGRRLCKHSTLENTHIFCPTSALNEASRPPP